MEAPKEKQAIVLVCSAAFNKEHFIALQNKGAIHSVIAVDGGFRYMDDCGVTPDCAVGDFDSLGFVPDDIQTLVYPEEKDESDFDLALSKVYEWYISSKLPVIVYGALGGRLDHNQAAINVVFKYALKGLNIILIGEDFAFKAMIGPEIFHVPRKPKGSIVSVFSYSEECQGVTEQNLKYPLENYTLKNCSSLGLSNEQMGEQASISLKNGQLSVFYQL